jgi:transcriptional regulator with XRE-family HTH domain
MSPEQCRAARAFLGWSMDELAARANCSNSTIRDFEAVRREPHRNRLATIRQALEQAGIVFTGEGSGMLGIAGKPRGDESRAVIVEKKAVPPARQRKAGGTKKRA